MISGVSGECLYNVYARSMAPARYEGRVRRVTYAFFPVLELVWSAIVGVNGSMRCKDDV